MTDNLVLVDVQNALDEDASEADSDAQPPAVERLVNWANLAYQQVASSPTEVTIRLVDESEMAALNEAYRGKQGTTNVLSFPFENEFDISAEIAADGVEQAAELLDDDLLGGDLLGDIVICHKVIQREAKEQGKSQTNHYAHMVTHGVLHLCGYDHENDQEADEMEALEIKILAQSRIENPYT